MSKEIVSGVGARYGALMNLDTTTGLPLPAVASAAPMQGSLVQGIKTMTVTDPEPQRITHYGDDRPYAQDSLPATEVGSFAITTSKSNMIIDAMVMGDKIRTIDSLQAHVGNSDQKGNEPQMMFAAYRQALDTKIGSTTFGKLRQWQLRIYPSTRITPQSESFEQAATDKTYNATPSPVTVTPWNEVLNTTNWGDTQGEYIEIITDYQPRFNVYRGDGTIVAFQLSHAPVSSSYLHVWVDGTLTSPSAVNTAAANPAFTLGAAPGVAKQVFALIEVLAPGNT